MASFRKAAFFLIALAIHVSVYAQTPSGELTLPDIPDSLRTPAARAGFLVEHFWDNFDFSNDKRTTDPVFIEQSFVNMLSVLPVAGPDSQKKGIESMLAATGEQTGQIMKLAEKYLFQTDSPFANDEIYMLFVDAARENQCLSAETVARLDAQNEILQMNRKGSKASDFEYESPDGKLQTLYSNGHPFLLLIFYDPDCSHCTKTIETFAAEPYVNLLVREGTLKVLAINSDGDKDRWKQSLSLIPKNWETGYENGTIQDEDLYYFRKNPTIYLLAPDNTVLLKDSDVGEVITFLLTLK